MFATCAVPLLVAGCSSDDPTPRISPTNSVATTASSSAPTTSPTASSRSPEQTVRAWVKARNAALQDGDTTAVDALAATGCEACQNSTDPIRQVYADGGHFETDGWRLVASRIKSASSGRATVATAIKYSAGRTVQEAGAQPVTYGVERHIVMFKLVTVSGDWRIGFIGYLS
ncbi:DUF6318 family protein [Nocardioides sp.]|uniref:DUF6318 family protein n=1 Tax=Nocardioides sp. TaxID=35761 RepID=UPI0031FE93CC